MVHRRRALAATFVCFVAGCARFGFSRNDDGFGSMRGIRLSASAKPVSDSISALEVILRGENTTRELKYLTVGGGCSEPGDMVRVVVASGDRRWDSDVWRTQRHEQERAERLKKNPNDPLRGETVCLAYAVALRLAPGTVGTLSTATLPFTAILGDSLPDGRYSVRAFHGKEGVRMAGPNVARKVVHVELRRSGG